ERCPYHKPYMIVAQRLLALNGGGGIHDSLCKAARNFESHPIMVAAERHNVRPLVTGPALRQPTNHGNYIRTHGLLQREALRRPREVWGHTKGKKAGRVRFSSRLINWSRGITLACRAACKCGQRVARRGRSEPEPLRPTADRAKPHHYPLPERRIQN